MSKIQMQRESLRDIAHEITPLLESHYKEIALYQDKIPLDINWDQYLSLEDLDILHIVTVRDGGDLIGYSANFVQYNPHYQSTLFGVNDILFLHKDYRGGTIAYRLFKEVEKQLKDRGVQVLTVHFKTYAPFDKLLEKLEWDYSERLYTKYIGE